MTLTFIYLTARGLFPMPGALGQYDILAQCLAEQTFTDYETIIVDRHNTLPRPEIELAVRKSSGGVRFLRPRMTPWTRIGAFAPNAARNTALCYARGETIVGIDDCYVFGPHYFERIAELASERKYTVAKLSQVDNSVAYPQRPNGPFPADQYGGGITSYPLAAAIAVNGWDERFDGGSGGDVDFFARLRLYGGEFVTDEAVAVVGHWDGGRTLALPRCDRLSIELGVRRRKAGALRANESWTAEEILAWKHCGRSASPRICKVSGFACDYKDTEPADITALREQYETKPWFNLAEERRKNGLLT